MTGAIVYEGPSLLNGAPIVAIVTGLNGQSHNPKTGPMAQAWILRADMPPMDAKRQNLDDAICGDCVMRGDGGFGASCYVTVWLGPNQVYRAFRKGSYPTVCDAGRRGLLISRSVRLGAYGDPAAVPWRVWKDLTAQSDGWIGYTHQWATCDRRFRSLLMASVDSEDEQRHAHAAGWRTFRSRGFHDRVLPNEFICPASRESGHRTTCEHCQLCAGTSSPARSVAIIVHGKPGNVAAFYRSRG